MYVYFKYLDIWLQNQIFNVPFAVQFNHLLFRGTGA